MSFFFFLGSIKTDLRGLVFFGLFKVFPSLKLHHIGRPSIGYKLQPNISLKGFQSDSIKLEENHLLRWVQKMRVFRSASSMRPCCIPAGPRKLGGTFGFKLGILSDPSIEKNCRKSLVPKKLEKLTVDLSSNLKKKWAKFPIEPGFLSSPKKWLARIPSFGLNDG